MDIRIVERWDAASAIDQTAWDSLAERSVTPNPFFERWCLLPALQYYGRDDLLYVVTIYDNDQLVGLFPICRMKLFLNFSYLMIWRFKDCLLTNALYDKDLCFPKLYDFLFVWFRSHCLISGTHNQQGFVTGQQHAYCQIRRTRKAVAEPLTWDEYLLRTPGKIRKENNRIMSRMLIREKANYVTADTGLIEKWLPLYYEVEQQSWKAGEGRSITLDSERRHFFHALMETAEPLNKIEFQALLKGREPLAVSFRFKAQRNAYEIKTSYNEQYKRFYPGVVLELLNLKHILQQDFDVVDSCTSNNEVVKRIWPNEIEVFRTTLFANSVTGYLMKVLYNLHLRARRRHHGTRFVCR